MVNVESCVCTMMMMMMIIAVSTCFPHSNLPFLPPSTATLGLASPLQHSCSGQGHLDMHVNKPSNTFPSSPHLTSLKYSALFLRSSAFLVSMTPYSLFSPLTYPTPAFSGLGCRFKGSLVLSRTVSLLSVYVTFLF